MGLIGRPEQISFVKDLKTHKFVSERSKLKNYIKRTTTEGPARVKQDLDKIEALQTLYVQVGDTVVPLQIKYETDFALKQGHRTRFGATQLLHHNIDHNKFTIEVKEAIPVGDPNDQIAAAEIEEDEDFDEVDDEEEADESPIQQT